jgi:hypothetical protein
VRRLFSLLILVGVVAISCVGCSPDDASDTATTTSASETTVPTIRETPSDGGVAGDGGVTATDGRVPVPLWEHTGTGDAVVPCLDCNLGTGLILSIRHTGDEQFTVSAVDQSGSPVPGPRHPTNSGAVVEGFQRIGVSAGAQLDPARAAVVVDTVGPYEGLIFFWPDEIDSSDVTHVAVEADGSWTIGAWNVPSSPQVTSVRGQVLYDQVSGVGDDVVYWQVPECNIDHLSADYQGAGGFLALGWGAIGNHPLLFNETEPGAYDVYDPFQEPLQAGWCDGLFMIEVRATGPWTMTVHPAE